MMITKMQSWITHIHGDIHYHLHLHCFQYDDFHFSSECLSEYEEPKNVIFMCPKFISERKQLELLFGEPYKSKQSICKCCIHVRVTTKKREDNTHCISKLLLL